MKTLENKAPDKNNLARINEEKIIVYLSKHKDKFISLYIKEILPVRVMEYLDDILEDAVNKAKKVMLLFHLPVNKEDENIDLNVLSSRLKDLQKKLSLSNSDLIRLMTYKLKNEKVAIIGFTSEKAYPYLIMTGNTSNLNKYFTFVLGSGMLDLDNSFNILGNELAEKLFLQFLGRDKNKDKIYFLKKILVVIVNNLSYLDEEDITEEVIKEEIKNSVYTPDISEINLKVVYSRCLLYKAIGMYVPLNIKDSNKKISNVKKLHEFREFVAEEVFIRVVEELWEQGILDG